MRGKAVSIKNPRIVVVLTGSDFKKVKHLNINLSDP